MVRPVTFPFCSSSTTNHLRKGYVLLILLFAVFVLSIGLLVAVPILETQLQREKEEELIFRGNQYADAVRRFVTQNPGKYPQSFDELLEGRFLRKPFADPMTPDGEWNVILLWETAGSGSGSSPQKVLVAPEISLTSISNPKIIGVVSASTRESIKILDEQTSYDKWLFFYGKDPDQLPEIILFSELEKK
ncbi:MAG: type II secretion system protein [Candidatus Aminicenantes bacterium]|nr:type II secretion system protein [Candidatus Aminicenantes bacterium]